MCGFFGGGFLILKPAKNLIVLFILTESGTSCTTDSGVILGQQ